MSILQIVLNTSQFKVYAVLFVQLTGYEISSRNFFFHSVGYDEVVNYLLCLKFNIDYCIIRIRCDYLRNSKQGRLLFVTQWNEWRQIV